jgi:hypothetical protein
MRTTNKGMAQLRHAHRMAMEFCRHGRGNLTKNVNMVYVEAMHTETMMTTLIMGKRDFNLWCDAQEKVFNAIIRLGYGMHEVRTGK